MGKPTTRWVLLKKRLLEVCPSYFSTTGIYYYQPENQQPKQPDVFLLKFWCSYDRKGLLHGKLVIGESLYPLWNSLLARLYVANMILRAKINRIIIVYEGCWSSYDEMTKSSVAASLSMPSLCVVLWLYDRHSLTKWNCWNSFGLGSDQLWRKGRKKGQYISTFNLGVLLWPFCYVYSMHTWMDGSNKHAFLQSVVFVSSVPVDSAF